jgi:hypothetical protein
LLRLCAPFPSSPGPTQWGQQYEKNGNTTNPVHANLSFVEIRRIFGPLGLFFLFWGESVKGTNEESHEKASKYIMVSNIKKQYQPIAFVHPQYSYIHVDAALKNIIKLFNFFCTQRRMKRVLNQNFELFGNCTLIISR